MDRFILKHLEKLTNSVNHYSHKDSDSNKAIIGKHIKQPIVLGTKIYSSNSVHIIKPMKKSPIVCTSSSIATSMTASASSSNENKSSSSSGSKDNSAGNGNKNDNNGGNQITIQNSGHHNNSSSNGNGSNHNNHSKALNETKKLTHQENINHISHILNMANIDIPNGHTSHKTSTKLFNHERHYIYNKGANFSNLIHRHYRGQNNKPNPDTKCKLNDYWKHNPHNPKNSHFNLGKESIN